MWQDCDTCRVTKDLPSLFAWKGLLLCEYCYTRRLREVDPEKVCVYCGRPTPCPEAGCLSQVPPGC